MHSLLRCVCLLLLCPTIVIATKLDFACQASLDEADQPLQRVPLSVEIIPALTRADLGDIAVFNADPKQQVHNVLLATSPSRDFARAVISRIQSLRHTAGYRYLRLTPFDSVTRFDLQRVDARYHERGPAAELRHRIQSERLEDDGMTCYSIPFPSQVNAASMRVIPATANRMISGQLYASWDKAGTRSLIQHGFHQHNNENQDIRPSAPVKLARRPYRSIALTSDVALPRAPTIELVYPQYELLFVGDGKTPCTLAWGNCEIGGPVSNLSAIMPGSLQLAQQDAALVRPGGIAQACGQSRLMPQTALSWKKWLLWTLLIFAVIVTARMALKLY